ncbi:MAG TPA: hypothetical protein VMB77_03005 [Syntrophales bacterium]|nr:hypothetical protein [Syntrophales bacterium]
MKMLQCLLVIVISVGWLMGCGSGGPSPQAKDATQGRAETKVVEAASAAGYNGSQMRKKIDRVLVQNDERTKEIKKGAGDPTESKK